VDFHGIYLLCAHHAMLSSSYGFCEELTKNKESARPETLPTTKSGQWVLDLDHDHKHNFPAATILPATWMEFTQVTKQRTKILHGP
jgi:hypothetical protein